MSAVDIARDLMGTVNRLGALEVRTEDMLKYQERIEAKLDALIDRLARVEANYENMRASVKNEIMAEIGRELTKAQVYLDLNAKGLLAIPFQAGGDGDSTPVKRGGAPKSD